MDRAESQILHSAVFQKSDKVTNFDEEGDCLLSEHS